jgi:hypothetical protein
MIDLPLKNKASYYIIGISYNRASYLPLL